MIWIGLGLGIAAILPFIYWRLRKTRQTRLISLVALVREPVTMDPTILASVAKKAWKKDVGDGNSEGPDGFVAATGPMNVIMCEERVHLINSFPQPYVENFDAVAESITDLRIRELFSQHRAWFSCDAMGVDGGTPPMEIQNWYQRLGQLLVEMLDENCLLIFVPDSELCYPINEETEAALRSPDPLTALRETKTVPIIEVAPDDPLMIQAVEKAQREWPKFVAAFENKKGENFAVKAPVKRAGNTEFIWIEVTAIEGERIYGTLGNDPASLGPLKLGSKVSAPIATLNDWCYLDGAGDVVGGFTITAVAKAARKSKA
jgi:uncharacterized protein YegJ (DUF2314 family)